MFLLSRLGPALRFIREQRSLTQKQVAAAADVTAPMLSSYENQRALPEIATLDRILHEGLGASLAELERAIAIVNDRAVSPGAHASSAEPAAYAPRAAMPADLSSVLATLPGGAKRDALPPVLETGYAQIVHGLITISRHVVETLAETARREPPRAPRGRRR